jgi:hypothetical protein
MVHFQVCSVDTKPMTCAGAPQAFRKGMIDILGTERRTNSGSNAFTDSLFSALYQEFQSYLFDGPVGLWHKTWFWGPLKLESILMIHELDLGLYQTSRPVQQDPSTNFGVRSCPVRKLICPVLLSPI